MKLFTPERLHELLAQSDFVVVTAPRTPESIGLLGEAEFRAMKPTALLHLLLARRDRRRRGAARGRSRRAGSRAAGLDAHDPEPLPADSPYWDMPNTLVTPHNGATTPQTRQRGIDIFVENLRRYQAGEEMVNVIDKQKGY